MPLRDRPIKYDGPPYPAPNRDLLQYPGVKEWPPLYNTDNVEKRVVEPQQNATDGKGTIRLPFREEENVCSNCGWKGVRQDPKEIAHVCEDCGMILPGHTFSDNVGNRHEKQGEEFGQDARFPDSDKNGAQNTMIKFEDNVRTSQYDDEADTKAELVRMGAEVIGDKVKLYRGGDVDVETLKDLRYNDYLSTVGSGRDAYGNAGAGYYGGTVISIVLPISDIAMSNGEVQYKGQSKSLSSGAKYPQAIYRAYNDFYGSNYTSKEIDDMNPNEVRNVARNGLSWGVEEYDELMIAHRTGQAYNSGPGSDWQKPKLDKLDPYKLFERNLTNRSDMTQQPDGLAPLEAAGFGLLYGNPHKDKIWRGDNPVKITDRSKHLREHMEGVPE